MQHLICVWDTDRCSSCTATLLLPQQLHHLHQRAVCTAVLSVACFVQTWQRHNVQHCQRLYHTNVSQSLADTRLSPESAQSEKVGKRRVLSTYRRGVTCCYHHDQHHDSRRSSSIQACVVALFVQQLLTSICSHVCQSRSDCCIVARRAALHTWANRLPACMLPHSVTNCSLKSLSA